MISSATKSPTKSQRKAVKSISFLIVPEGGSPLRFKIKTFWLKFFAGFVVAFVIVLVIGAISYSNLLSRALDRDRLLEDNKRLAEENKKIATLAKEVEESRASLNRIVRSLGGKLELDVPIEAGK